VLTSLNLETTAATNNVVGALNSLIETLPRSVYSLANLTKTQELGAGAFGQVYAATDRKSGDQVVVKKIPVDSVQELVAVRREAEILEHLKPDCEPYLLCYEGLIEEKDFAYVITKREKGMVTLHDALYESNTPFPANDDVLAAEIIVNLIKGLQLLHSKGVAHRDIKPANILVELKGGSKIKFIDFGLSCLG